MGKQLKSRWDFRTVEAAVGSARKFTPVFSAEAPMSKIELTPDQEAEAQRLAKLVGQKVQEEVLQMYRLLMSKPDSQLLGQAGGIRPVAASHSGRTMVGAGPATANSIAPAQSRGRSRLDAAARELPPRPGRPNHRRDGPALGCPLITLDRQLRAYPHVRLAP